MSISLKVIKEQGLSDLCYITQLLKENSINYWLDYGTLLGCIREKEALKWDGEFDISLWNDDLNDFLNLIPKIVDKGLEIELHDGTHYSRNFKYANIKVTNPKLTEVGSFVIDIHFYIKEGKFAKRPFGGYLFKNYFIEKATSILVRNKYLLPFYVISNKRYAKPKSVNFATVYDIFLNHFSVEEIEKSIIKQEIKVTEKRGRLEIRIPKTNSVFLNSNSATRKSISDYLGGIYALAPFWFIKFTNPLYSFINNNSEKTFKKEVIIEADFFQEFVESEFHGRMQMVPKYYEKYLETVYGDWKTPKKHWNTDDHSEVFHSKK